MTIQGAKMSFLSYFSKQGRLTLGASVELNLSEDTSLDNLVVNGAIINGISKHVHLETRNLTALYSLAFNKYVLDAFVGLCSVF